MTVYKDEIEFYRGDFYPKAVFIYNAETSEPIDLEGSELTMTVNSLKDPEDISTQMFSVEGVIDGDPKTGIAYFTPTEQDTDIPKGIYWYDISMKIGTSSKRTVKKNKFIILMDIGK